MLLTLLSSCLWINLPVFGNGPGPTYSVSVSPCFTWLPGMLTTSQCCQCLRWGFERDGMSGPMIQIFNYKILLFYYIYSYCKWYNCFLVKFKFNVTLKFEYKMYTQMHFEKTLIKYQVNYK